MEIQNNVVSTRLRPLSQSDYLPWQRASRQSGSLASVKSGENAQRVSIRTNRTACSSVCRHSWNKKGYVAANTNKDDDNRKKLLTILEMQVKMRESSLNDYKKRYKELVKENFNLKEEISSSEGKTYGEATTLLQCYKRFRGAIGALNRHYSTQLTTTREEFDETKEKILKDIQVIKVQVDDVDRRLLAKKEEVTRLLNYKDKEYPGKALQIAKLKRQRDRLNITQKGELQGLSDTMEKDRLKRQNKHDMQHRKTCGNIHEVAIRSLDANVNELILQNLIMKKEIDIHRNEILELEGINSRFEHEIREILQDKNLNPAEQLFPDIFREKKKCLPQDDIHLDIPLQTWLPI